MRDGSLSLQSELGQHIAYGLGLSAGILIPYVARSRRGLGGGSRLKSMREGETYLWFLLWFWAGDAGVGTGTGAEGPPRVGGG